MSPARVIVIEIVAKNPPQMPLVEDNHMIQTVTAYRSDNAFNIRVLPRRARRRDDLIYA